MPSPSTGRAPRARFALAFVVAALALPSCKAPEKPLLPRAQTWAELRTVRRAVAVTPPGDKERAPYPRERLVDGELVKVAAEGLAWLRRDGGATLLVRGPASLTVRSDVIEVAEGRVFVDTPTGPTTDLATPSGPLHLAHVRASIDVRKDGATEAYVLAGEVRTDGAAHAAAGERLSIVGKADAAKATATPVLAWDDWTGGLATTDRTAEPSPYGVGTVGARRPGEQGTPRFPLAIQKLDVHVTVDGDFALTEVDELFFNPSSDVVEGIYRFRTSEGATLHRFGVDREGAIVWGRVKEKQAAAAQYQANVYRGSTEDPALLEWDAPGVYRARLYPIGPGESRRVVVRYGEWLGRTGPRGERRLYVYPMAAEGAEGSLPSIEELVVTLDLGKAGAREVRAGMAGVRTADSIVVREHDLSPRADLAVELFDDGLASPRGFTSPHVVDLETLPPSERDEAQRLAKQEADYVIVPIRAADVPAPPGGLDLAIVVDTSAATEAASLAIARAATAALLAHLGPSDRALVMAGDDGLRPVVPGWTDLAPVDETRRRDVLTSLAAVARGGATDLGAMLSQAAAKLDPKRRGLVVYVGDGSPTVGELALPDLRDRLAKLPTPVRIFGLGVGDGADMALLEGIARGSFAERIGDANGAARAALRLLETAERPAWLGASVDLGPSIERVFPRDLGALVADEGAVVVGRVASRPLPSSVTLNGPGGATKLPVSIASIEDDGDLRRRWAEGRLSQMLDEAAGRAAMVDLGSRHGIITPVTSLYVPTTREMSAEERAELAQAKRSHRVEPPRSKTSSSGFFRNADEAAATAEVAADAKEGGTGTRAKGEEGSMGNPNTRSTGRRYGVAGPSDAPAAAAPAPAPQTIAPPRAAQGLAAATPPPMAAPSAMGASNAPMPTAKAGGKDQDATKALDGVPADARIAREQALRESAEFGMIGLLNSGSGSGEPNAPAAPWGRDDASGGPMGGEVGNAFGAGGLGLSGIGEGGGGRSGEGIGLGDVGTIGHGEGQGFGGGHGMLGGPGGARPKAKVADGKPVLENEKKADKALAKQATAEKVSVVVRVGDVPHASLRCGDAASAPLEERMGLWRERLARVTGNAQAVAAVYRRALASCEAPAWRERAALLGLLLDAMPSVSGRVALWRGMGRDLGTADALYRGLLARVRTPQEMRELHAALGLRSVDPSLLAKTIEDAPTPEARAKKLRELFAAWPDDFTLALALLDALEDAKDDAGARELGRALRMRPDADARVRTAVGELYLRLAARAASKELGAVDEAEARRAFGEIVEFAPDDPVARRRLGDLLRAHAWFAEAARQYETLARLAPDDATVALLLAAAAEGQGRLEEAVKWTEKGGAAGAPDVSQSPAATARAFAATYLAWGRLAALDAGKKDEAQNLAARLARVLSTDRRASGKGPRGTRVALTWAHPELHPTLWTNALGSPMPAPEGDVMLGIAQAIVPVRDDAFVEVRLEPDEVEHAARLRATAMLTVVFDETGEGERILKVPVRFEAKGPATRRFELRAGAVREVTP
jgi:Ca-activated chloride channel family protein